ncbi:uncharacterized protein CC84DRAFT_1165908 [Paraphaeosphaeria sporulosa]|uniref:Uncharacterized protein n=1 Tax=Paraphaeosphaeria sporulosa TaxID=1460663 RepID=A0A177C9C3_9PLEO|nr:uncharacterized protein CC84DRAFT_1165908 [Paraphaeosphaeria sporulosa]OAG03721.1 hypothetical protein CC84DRAFT_1165908 [Paraphaeosphaeria sporulosa]
MSLRLISLAFIASALATPLEKLARDACNACNPSGATGTNPPSIGTDLSSLYTDVLASVKDIHFRARSADSVEARDGGFCCAETLDCVNVQNLNIPMCYDKFTTNFAFADRSYGSLTTGNYTQGGSEANLFTGQYSKDGTEGNIYSEDPAAKPNTATLSIPPQWTEAGVGSAIPPTAIVGSVSVPAQTSVETTATASAQSSGQTSAPSGTAASQATGSATSGNEATSATSTPGAADKGTPSLIMVGLAALLYAV